MSVLYSLRVCKVTALDEVKTVMFTVYYYKSETVDKIKAVLEILILYCAIVALNVTKATGGNQSLFIIFIHKILSKPVNMLCSSIYLYIC